MSYQFSVAVALLFIPICLYLSKRLGLLFGCFSTYMAIYASYLSFNMHNRYEYFTPLMNTMSINSGFSLLYCVIFLFGVLLMPKSILANFRYAIPLWSLCDALYVLHSYSKGLILPGGNAYAGFLDYGGMNATGMALGCAFVLPDDKCPKAERYLRYLGLLIIITGIILSKSAIPFFILGVILGCLFLFKSKNLSLVNLWPLFTALLLGVVTVGHKMHNSSFRFDAYRIFFKSLKETKGLLFGNGLGSLRVMSGQVQLEQKFMVWLENGKLKGWVWQWLHSDILQTWWENGVFAFVFLLLVYLECLYRSFKKRDFPLLSLGLGLGIAGGVNYPCRYAVTAFFVTYFLVSALDKKTA
jgi:hypothetical protein